MTHYGFDERDTTTAVTREAQYAPQQPMPPAQMQYGYGQQPGFGFRSPYGFRPRHTIETKPFFLTSEFVMTILASIAIAISAATMHAFGGWRAWILITALIVSYNLSRGIAKSGTRSRAHDPREDVHLDFGRGRDREHAHDGA